MPIEQEVVMAELPDVRGTQAKRLLEQPPDAISLYSDLAQVLGTDHEVFLQFYESIPKAPDAEGRVTEVTSRLRVTVVLSPAHALRLGRSLVRKTEETESRQAE